MVEINNQEYERQIAAIVEGFVQMWIKFEAQLHRDLAQQHFQLSGNQNTEDNSERVNLDLFYRVSSIIYRRQKITMSELSAELSVPFSTATRIMNWFVNKGYALRLPDPDDRRVVFVMLSPKGIDLYELIQNHTASRVQQLLDVLSAEEKVIMFNLFGKVVSALRKMTR